MALLLQPRLHLPPLWFTRVLLVGLLALIVFSFGFVQQAQQRRSVILYNGKPNAQNYMSIVTQLLRQSRQRIWLMQYVIRLDVEQKSGPVHALCKELIQAAARGVDVRVCVEHSRREGTYPGPDNSAVVAYLRDRGVIVHEDELDVRTHAKALLIDETSIVGSHNWTYSALTSNRELSVLSEAPEVVDGLEEAFRSVEGWGL